MTQGLMQWGPVFDEYAEQHGYDGHPTPCRPATDEHHIERCHEVENEDGGNEPELIDEAVPQSPADKHVSDGLGQRELPLII